MSIVEQSRTTERDATALAAGWHTICALAQLEPLWGEAALVGEHQIALFLLADGRLFVVSNGDPATGSQVMSRGIVGSRGDRPTVASPLHKQVYDLQTGECFGSPEYVLPIYPVRVDNAWVQVRVPSTAVL